MRRIIYTADMITEHFSAKEYGQNCEGDIYFSSEARLFYQTLERFRKWLRRKMFITSGYRTSTLNKKYGGVPSSNHLRGCAADWHCNIKIDEKKFIKYAKMWARYCYEVGEVGEAGLYNNFVHLGFQSESQKQINKGKFIAWDARSGKTVLNAFPELIGI